MSGRIYATIQADSRGIITVMPSVVTFEDIVETASEVCNT